MTRESGRLTRSARLSPLLWLVACGLFLLPRLSHAQCVPDLNLTSWNGAPLYLATNSITAGTSFTINDVNAGVTFKAGTVIKLENGFRATALSAAPNFHATIQACTTTALASKDHIRLGNRVIAIENH